MTPQGLTAAFEALAEAPDGVSRLRELVLQLAVRGKLVPQDPNDEPASELLRRIADARASRPELALLPPVNPETYPYDLPSGWEWCRLGALGVIGSSRRVHKRDWTTTGVPFLRAREIVKLSKHGQAENELFIAEDHFRRLSRDGLTPEPNDLMITGVGTIGVPYVVKQTDRFYFKDASVLIFKNRFGLYPHYICTVLKSPSWIREIHKESMGTTVHTLTIARANLAPFPLPPLAEQHRIVAKVDELMGLLDQLEAARNTRENTRIALRDAALAALQNAETSDEVEVAWNRIAERMDDLLIDPADVEPLRQTVLQLAVRGRLVPQDPNDELATMAKVADVITFLNGYAFKSEWYRDQGIRLVRNQNISPGKIDWSDCKFISDERASEFKRFRLEQGDIVLSLDRPIISSGLKVATIGPADLPCVLLQRVACPRPQGGRVDRQYFLLWLRSPSFVDVIDPGRSNGVPHISTRSLEKMRFRLPSLAEQHRIVAKVDELMALLDQLEERLSAKVAAHDAFAAAAVQHLDV